MVGGIQPGIGVGPAGGEATSPVASHEPYTQSCRTRKPPPTAAHALTGAGRRLVSGRAGAVARPAAEGSVSTGAYWL
jgi:hypothetical protein